MAKRRDPAPRRSEPPPRPAWISPVFPVLLLLSGVGMLFIDGLRPYRIWWRRNHWQRVEGRLMQSYQPRRRVRMSAQGSTPRTYLERRPQQKIFKAVVEKGWPLTRRKEVYRVRVNYTYLWKKKKHTRVGDSPRRDFESEPVARRFLGDYIRERTIRVWVNPADPSQATAFLLYGGAALWAQIGMVAIALGLIWLLVALLLGRAHARREAPKPAAPPSPQSGARREA